MTEILTPRCPLCWSEPAIVIPGGIQAFCGNEDCMLLCWNPSLTLEANLRDAGVVDLPPMEDGSDG